MDFSRKIGELGDALDHQGYDVRPHFFLEKLPDELLLFWVQVFRVERKIFFFSISSLTSSQIRLNSACWSRTISWISSRMAAGACSRCMFLILGPNPPSASR